MTWNFHNYYANRTEGLIAKLLLSSDEEARLCKLRDIVRSRVREVFNEARSIAKSAKDNSESYQAMLIKVTNGRFQYLSGEEQEEIATLIYKMDEEAHKAFLSLAPRYWTQGSFKYKTLNKPFQPGQEMDIDDGVYLPMPVFKGEPKLGHSLLFLVVDAALKSLAAENQNWIFEPKKTCSRIKIGGQKTHIDVPMYAIPTDKFIEKEQHSVVKNRAFLESKATTNDEDSQSFQLDSEYVNLALRDGDKKWINSDPKVVEDWFNESCRRNGPHVRKICRFMKAWRDAQWDIGGPSSISLMAAVVNILDIYPCPSDDFDIAMKLVANHITQQYRLGIASPDPADEKPLFPAETFHSDREKAILKKLDAFHLQLVEASQASTKEGALKAMSSVFGSRVKNADLIVSVAAAPAFVEEASTAEKPETINSTMISG